MKGAIFLQNCTVEPSANKKKNQWIFEINTSIRTYFISASSEQEMKNWIQAIRNATAESESKKIVDQQKKQLNLIVENQVDNYIQSSLSSDRKNEPQLDLQNNNESSSSASTTEIKSTSDPVVQTSGLTTADLLNQLLASENQEKEKSVEIKEAKEVKESPSSPSHSSSSPLPSPTPSPPSPLKSEVEVKEEIVVEEKKDEQSLNDTNETVVSETPKKEKRETRRALKKNDDDDDDEDVDDDSDDYVDDDDDDD